MAGFSTAGWQSASDAVSQTQANPSAWLDRFLGRVDDGVSAYDKVRCAVNPRAPGCYTAAPSANHPQVVQGNSWLYVGLVVVILLVIVIVVIALKK